MSRRRLRGSRCANRGTFSCLLRRDGRQLWVRGLDAIGGTPVLDLKPVVREFFPEGEIRQPAWTHELMEHYWQR